MRIALTTILMAISSMAMAAGDGLAICSKCPGTSLVSLSGADTSNARAIARISEDDMRSWCQGWHPQYSAAETEECVCQGWRVETVEASADCKAETLTVDGIEWIGGGGGWFVEGSGVYHSPGTELTNWANANFSLMCPSVQLVSGPVDGD